MFNEYYIKNQYFIIYDRNSCHPGCPFVIPSILFVIPSVAEGSVNSFYRFLHSLCSVEMTEKVPFGRNDNSCTASVSYGNLADRCGPVGPSHLNPQSLRDSPLLRGATPIHPLAGGPVAGHRPAP